MEENTKLHNIISLLKHNDTLSEKEICNDTVYKYTGAKVISNTVNKKNNFIIVDKGSNDSIEKEMAVVSDKGLAGIVIGVSPHYSIIMSMLHQNSVISARIKKNNQLVNVIWGTDDIRFGRVEDIPSHIKLYKGDTVVTSGNSLIFPPGIEIGTIEKYEADSLKNLNSAIIRFSTDFNGLHWVYIIKNRDKKEQQSLTDSIAQ